MNIKKTVLSLSFISILALLSPTSALAHVSVSPGEVGVATTQKFTVGFGVEKDIPTTAIRLVIPEGVESVAPLLRAGWKIDIKSDGEREGTKVTEITWSNGSVPAGYREEFEFRAKAPSNTTTLAWKAYQTYSDGSVVAWDKNPDEVKEEGGNEAEETSGPYSETKVIDDLTEGASTTKADQTTTWISYGALLLGAVAIALVLRKR